MAMKKTKDFLKGLDEDKLTEIAKKDDGLTKQGTIKKAWLNEHKDDPKLSKQINLVISMAKWNKK